MEDGEYVDSAEQQDVEASADVAPEQDSGAEPQAQGAAPPQANWGVMENFRRIPQFSGMSEQQIAQTLYQTMQREQAASRHLAQYQQIFPSIQQYLADRPQYESWRKSQQAQAHPQAQAAAAAQQAQQQKSSWWNPPEVREAYKQYLVKDENGREVISQEAPLDARHALAEFQSYKANFAKQFLEDPEKALGPMVEGRAKQIAQEIVQQTMKQRDNETFVDRLQSENQDWLFDQDGNVTPEGMAVHKYVEQARSMGIASPQDRWQYARDRVEHELLLRDFAARQSAPPANYQGQQQPQAASPAPQQDAEAARAARASQNMEYLRREAARSPSRSAGTTNNDPRAPRPKMSFEQMLIADAQGRGLL